MNMPPLLIDCPETGFPVRTGRSVSKEEFQELDLEDEIVDCPYCDHTHTWDKDDAYFRDEADDGSDFHG